MERDLDLDENEIVSEGGKTPGGERRQGVLNVYTQNTTTPNKSQKKLITNQSIMNERRQDLYTDTREIIKIETIIFKTVSKVCSVVDVTTIRK